MTAKTKDGKIVFNGQKIYMPQSPAKGRDDKMVYGPHRKSGMLRDTALQPGQTRAETMEIKFPYEDVEKDGKKVRTVTAKELDVVVSLWHLPAGGELAALEAGKGKFLFHESTRRVTVK
ncbi:MAG: hypothetical protein AB1413_07025 [Thermodesulfobacteriota bacterium]